jgi:DNA-binding transcriptional regulator YdaS (Cro superfamily)
MEVSMNNINFLRARMIEFYGSQWKFAAVIGLHEARVSQVIRGKVRLDTEEQKRWADALGVADIKQIFPEGGNADAV